MKTFNEAHQSGIKSSTHKVEGMHCASCALIIKKTLVKVPGITDASVNYATEEATIHFAESAVPIATINEAIGPFGYTILPSEIDQSSTHASDQQHLDHAESDTQSMYVTFPIALGVFAVMIYEILANQIWSLPPLPIPMRFWSFLLFIVSSIVLFGFGRRFLLALVRFVQYGTANMDTLVGLGTGAAYLYSAFLFVFPEVFTRVGIAQQQFFDVTIVVIGFITFGKYLESSSKRKTGEALSALMGLQVKTAIVLKNGKQVEVAIDQVAVGDIILVKPGTKIPIDGLVVEGTSAVDESLVTGESMPVDKHKGDMVIGATMNMEGMLHIKVTHSQSDTVLSHIIDQVKRAQGSKAPIERFVDTVSSIFVPTVLVISFITFVGWLFIGPTLLPSGHVLSMAIQSAIGVLIIACPCALGLATPTAVIVSVGKGARMGILVKDAESLEHLGTITGIVVDKTGTLTEGKPEVVKSISFQSDEKELLSILGSLEKNSEHPLATAIVKKAETDRIPLLPITNFRSIPGMGVEGNVKKSSYIAGNLRFMKERNVELSALRALSDENVGYTPVYLSNNRTLIGMVLIADQPKENAKHAVQSIQEHGIRIIMATGDTKESAGRIASSLGITEVRAEMTPEDKMKVIESLQKEGLRVAMVGDGVNDAPALAIADVGIAMSTGTDVAMSSSSITLLHGDISKVAQAIQLSKNTMSIIKQNLFWAFIYNIVGIPIAAGVLQPAFGITLSPVFAGAAMALSSVSVVMNSLRLQRG